MSNELPGGVLRLSGLALCIGYSLYGIAYYNAKREEAVFLSQRNLDRLSTRH